MRNPSILHTLHAPKPTGNLEKETQFKLVQAKNDQKEVAREVKLEKADAERKLAREMELHDAERDQAHADRCFPAPSVAPSAAPPAATVQARAALASKMPSGYVASQARATLASQHDESCNLAMSRLQVKRELAEEERGERVRMLERKRELDLHEVASNGLRAAQRESLDRAAHAPRGSASKKQKTAPPTPSRRLLDNVWGLLDGASSSSSTSLFTVVKACDNYVPKKTHEAWNSNYVPAKTHKAWNSSNKKGNTMWRSAK
jgi:hypothetical protein